MSKKATNPETVNFQEEPEMGRNKLETKLEVTFEAGYRDSEDADSPSREGRGEMAPRDDSPMKSVRFGSQASIGGETGNSLEIASLGSQAGEDGEGGKRPPRVHDTEEMVAKAMQALKSVKHVRQGAHAPNAIEEGHRFAGWNYLYDLIGHHDDT